MITIGSTQCDSAIFLYVYVNPIKRFKNYYSMLALIVSSKRSKQTAKLSKTTIKFTRITFCNIFLLKFLHLIVSSKLPI